MATGYEDYCAWGFLRDEWVKSYRNYQSYLGTNRPVLASRAYDRKNLMLTCIERYLMDKVCSQHPGKCVFFTSSLCELLELLQKKGKEITVEEAMAAMIDKSAMNLQPFVKEAGK